MASPVGLLAQFDECGAISPAVGGVLIENSVLWGNRDETVDLEESDQFGYSPEAEVSVAYTCFEVGISGVGNIDDDPCFVDRVGGNFRIRGGSPAMNAGSDALLSTDQFDLDADGNVTEPVSPDLDFGIRDIITVDMGAYEVCRADYNGDGFVNSADMLEFLNAHSNQEPRADMNGDGFWDTLDVLIYLNLFSTGCGTC